MIQETVSVDDAIKKGQRIVNLPVLAIMYGLLALGIIILTNNWLSGWAIGVTAALAIGLAWLYWSISITHWRLWAFENVRNVHELKERAIRKKLIWPDGNFFEKTEIRTKNQRQKWQELTAKFDRDDIFIENDVVPLKTIVHYSQDKSVNRCIIGCLIICASIYFLLSENVASSLIFLIIGGYVSVTGYLKIRNNKPQIIIDNNGIQTAKAPFYEWHFITNDVVERKREGKSVVTYFNYECPHGQVAIIIDSFDIEMDQLENLLYVYRSRSKHLRE
ncbi:hypothetical protein [Mucilaginibacter sp. HD30]